MNISHHAILVCTDSVCNFSLSEMNVSGEIIDQYDTKFGIDDARELVRKASNRPIVDSQQCLVVRTDFITHEAQNALLKILEEPPQSTKFIFVVPLDFDMLPTLASRFQLFKTAEVGNSPVAEFEAFKSSSFKDRLSAIEKSAKQKDTDWQRMIKQGLIGFINNSNHTKSLTELEFVARKLLTRGASNKMLLEHMALVLR